MFKYSYDFSVIEESFMYRIKPIDKNLCTYIKINKAEFDDNQKCELFLWEYKNMYLDFSLLTRIFILLNLSFYINDLSWRLTIDIFLLVFSNIYLEDLRV
jgi:hypothetical protein